MRTRRRTTAERSRINGRIEWSAPHLDEDRRMEDSEAAEGEEDAEGTWQRTEGDAVGGERGIQEEEGGGQDERRGRGATRSPLRCTLSW
ncbi:hypothetical protein K0M31_004695 [Melipona bicolor]|uniref:Uncharacterized protein n=1 Tax=Melipona bicolor TaxID=60889 RepID=A0AA40KNQ2_9HYME|nr:hypothetical protein K0M31_004695 [Melipona bicolor]